MDVPHLPQQLQADALADALKLQVDEPQLAHPSLHLYALLALHHLRLQLAHLSLHLALLALHHLRLQVQPLLPVHLPSRSPWLSYQKPRLDV